MRVIMTADGWSPLTWYFYKTTFVFCARPPISFIFKCLTLFLLSFWSSSSMPFHLACQVGKFWPNFGRPSFFLVATKIVNQTQFCVKNSFTAIKASPRISQSVFKAIVGHMSPFPYEIESNFTLTPNCQKTDKRLSVNQMSIVSACGLPFPLLVRLGFLPSSISSNIWIEEPRGKGVKSVNWSSLQAGGKSSWLTNRPQKQVAQVISLTEW